MDRIEYPSVEYSQLGELDQHALLAMLNKDRIRTHLVQHDLFTEATLAAWVAEKQAVDAAPGCRVRGICVNGAVAGWCGIQFENDAYELAIVLDESFWGVGIAVFKDMMTWAAELGHTRVVLHLFHTRPEYRFLRKMAARVYESTLFGQQYTSYELNVPPSN